MPRATTVLSGAAYAALAIADSVAAGRRGSTAARRLRFVLKPALMPALAAAFLDGTRGARGASRHRPPPGRDGRGPGVLLGRGPGAARHQRALVPDGVGSFSGAHVAYIAAFLSVRGLAAARTGPRHRGSRVALGLWLSAAPLLSVAAGRRDPALRVPVAAYATILAAMFATSACSTPRCRRAREGPCRPARRCSCSPTACSPSRSSSSPSPPVPESVVIATYTAGQGLIARGVAGAT